MQLVAHFGTTRNFQWAPWAPTQWMGFQTERAFTKMIKTGIVIMTDIFISVLSLTIGW